MNLRGEKSKTSKLGLAIKITKVWEEAVRPVSWLSEWWRRRWEWGCGGGRLITLLGLVDGIHNFPLQPGLQNLTFDQPHLSSNLVAKGTINVITWLLDHGKRDLLKKLKLPAFDGIDLKTLSALGGSAWGIGGGRAILLISVCSHFILLIRLLLFICFHHSIHLFHQCFQCHIKL